MTTQLTVRLAFLSLWLAISPTTFAQQEELTQATFETTVNEEQNLASATFTGRTAHVGDQIDQKLLFESSMKTIGRRENEVVEQRQSVLKQRQHRIITAVEIANDRMIEADVRYIVSERELTAGTDSSQTETDPVVGHKYHCFRNGTTLMVTDDQGQLPTLAEYKIVAGNMNSLGEVSPLAEFLVGKTVVVGQQISVPRDVADRLLALGQSLGKVESFHLKLTEIRTIGQVRCAGFEAFLEATDHNEGQMRVQLEGPFAVEIDGCRLVSSDLEGPIGVAKSMLDAGSTFHMTGTGRLRISLQSFYQDVD